MNITKEEFEQWRSNPVTLEIMKILMERQDKIAHQIASGACLGDESAHALAVGRYQEIDDLRKMKYEDMFSKIEVKTKERK